VVIDLPVGMQGAQRVVTHRAHRQNLAFPIRIGNLDRHYSRIVRRDGKGFVTCGFDLLAARFPRFAAAFAFRAH
jgi:hypothetical protein